MKDNLHIALLQYDVQWHNINANFKKIDEMLDSIKGNLDLVILPEMFATGFTMQPELISNDEFDLMRKWMADTSQKYQAAIMGSNPEAQNNE